MMRMMKVKTITRRKVTMTATIRVIQFLPRWLHLYYTFRPISKLYHFKNRTGLSKEESVSPWWGWILRTPFRGSRMIKLESDSHQFWKTMPRLTISEWLCVGLRRISVWLRTDRSSSTVLAPHTSGLVERDTDHLHWVRIFSVWTPLSLPFPYTLLEEDSNLQ